MKGVALCSYYPANLYGFVYQVKINSPQIHQKFTAGFSFST